MTPAPFSGVRILEVCSGIGGRSAGALLAGLGAEVVQVGMERGGPDDEPLRVWADRQKRQVSGDEGGLRRLADEVDVLICDLPPGELARRGLDAVTFRGRSPGAIHAWLPAFGSAGRWSHLAYDPLLLAAVSGYADHYPSDLDQPIAPVVPTLGYLHGAMGAAAVAAGLVGRRRDGCGRAATVTGLHAAGAALATLMVKGLDVASVSPGRSLRGGPFFRLYRAGDGAWLYLAALSPTIFIRALDAIGRMDVLVREDVAGEFSNMLLPDVRDAVNTELEKTFADAPAEQWVELLRAASVPATVVRSRQDWIDSDMAQEVTGWVHFDHPDVGEVRGPAFPISFSDDSAPVGPPSVALNPAPAAGLPLAGIRVIDISSYLAAPFAGLLLAASGAEVVKVEPPDGDPYRVHSVAYAVANQYKRAAALDLRDPVHQSALLRMVSAGDVLVDNFREGGLDRLGLDGARLSGANPDLVRCSVSAFGTSNRWSARPGFDPVLQSVTGLAAAQGGERPWPSTAPVVDVATGSLAALGILSALYTRECGGRGGHVRTSLAAGAVYIQSAEMLTYDSRPAPAVGGPEFAGPAPEQRYYRTLDGWLAVSARSEAERAAFYQVVGTRAGVEETIAGAATIAWVDRLSAAGVPAAQVLEHDDALDDPYLEANGLLTTLTVGQFGRFRVVGAFCSWGENPVPARRVTGVGADTAEVMRELGVEWPAAGS
ncbi:MAG TPA: CoA transferase [Acidimicrobiales bacterium]|nr:CoA transferase [Acidimicrobiales bacterium]